MKLKDLGGLIQSLIGTAIVGVAISMGSVAVLAWRANASEERVEIVEARQRTIELNQVRLGETQRYIRQDSEWTQRKLNALLDERNIPRPTRPALPAPTIVIEETTTP